MRINYPLIFQRKEAVPVKKNKGDIDDIFSTLKDKPKKVNVEEAVENKDTKKNKALKKTGSKSIKNFLDLSEILIR